MGEADLYIAGTPVVEQDQPEDARRRLLHLQGRAQAVGRSTNEEAHFTLKVKHLGFSEGAPLARILLVLLQLATGADDRGAGQADG